MYSKGDCTMFVLPIRESAGCNCCSKENIPKLRPLLFPMISYCNNSNIIYLLDTPAHNRVSPHQVLLQKVEWFSRYFLDNAEHTERQTWWFQNIPCHKVYKTSVGHSACPYWMSFDVLRMRKQIKGQMVYLCERCQPGLMLVPKPSRLRRMNR